MKKVTLTYNPFQLKTTILVDGKKPKENSSLSFGRKRLQEWVEHLPQYLVEEYRDENFNIEFTGTLADFNDFREAINAKRDKISVTLNHHQTPDVEEVEKQVIEIYKEIQAGPVTALKDAEITEAFKRAIGSEFEVNVVATMSSGKSTLINALLGRRLMPMANMATTATIVRITASNQKEFSAIALDAEDNEISREEVITYEIMDKWNKNDKISMIDIYGPIPSVKDVGMRLVLVDTPGPNNSCDKRHQAMTYEMLEDSDKSLVLFVMNAQQLNINDQEAFMDYVCKCMKQSGKQSRDRFIFAVNKLDCFEKDERIADALDSARSVLEDRDIQEPNIFPVGALPALEYRIEEEEPESLDRFIRKSSNHEQFHFEEYYEYNHLPLNSKIRIEEMLKKLNDNEQVIVHSGIVSIEEAIRLYVNKYARTIKVADLVASFKNRLKELQAVAEIQDRIEHDKAEKEKLDREIDQIQQQIQSGQSAKEYAQLIDEIDVTDEVKEEIDECVGNLQTRIDKLVYKNQSNTKVERQTALRLVRELEKERKDMQAQLDAKIKRIFDRSFRKTFDKVLTIYKERLQKLGFNSKGDSLDFKPIDFVGSEISNLDKILSDSTEVVDEGYMKTDYVTKSRRGKKKINWFFTPWHWGSERYETEYYQERVDTWISKEVEYVNMAQVSDRYFVPLQSDLVEAEKRVPSHIQKETARLKQTLKRQILQIDKALQDKLSALKDSTAKANRTAKEIQQQQENLRWMQSIIQRVDKLINY